jgi:hypothetical protein
MNTRHTQEQDTTRVDVLRESTKRGIFVDEFRIENPAVSSGGSCRPATTGPLAGKCIYGGPCKTVCRWRK